MSIKTFVIVGLPIIGVLLVSLFVFYLCIPTWFKAICPCITVPEPKPRIQVVEVPVIVTVQENKPPLYI